MLSETTLAKEVGTSRTPVREAIAQLEREGLLDQIPRYGTFVRVMGRDEIRELYDLRATLEGFAASEAARHITPAAAAKLLGLCDGMMDTMREIHRQAGESIDPLLAQKWLLADASFHTTVIREAGNRWTAKVAGDLRLMVQIFGHRREIPGKDMLAVWVRTWREHRRLVRALASHNAQEAQRIMVGHIMKGKNNALEYCDWANQHREAASYDALPKSLQQHLMSLDRYDEITDRQQSRRRGRRNRKRASNGRLSRA